MRSTTKTSTFRLAAIAAAAVGTLAACGGGGDDNDVADAVEAAANGEQLSSDDVAAIENEAEAMADEASSDVDLPDPCTLLAPEEVQAALGTPVSVGSATDSGIDSLECSFTGVPEGDAIPPSIFVRTLADCGEACRPTSGQSRDVADLGEHAYIDDVLSMISWTRDGVVYEVQIVLAGAMPTDEQLTTVAHQVDA